MKVKEVTQAFRRMKLNVGEMHSDLEQAQRDQIMHDFKSGKINILIATDIVSRGIDIDDIRLVINYDVPHDSEDYVHRIGRTARANNDGCAITFVSEKEQTQFKSIENFIGKDIYKIPVPEELGEAPEYNPRSNNGGKEKGTSKVKETIPHGNPETTLTVKNSKNNRSCKFCIIRHGKDIKAKTAYPIIDCGGRVHLPEPTVTTLRVIHKANIVFLGEQTSPLLIK